MKGEIMATEEQAKKEIVAALQALRVILTKSPKQEYSSDLWQYPKVKKRIQEIGSALTMHSIPPNKVHPENRDISALTLQYFGDDGVQLLQFLLCDVRWIEKLPLTQLPHDKEILGYIDGYIVEFGGTMPGELAVISLTPEGKTILETLADEHPMTVTQESLAEATRLSDRTIRNHLPYLRTKGLIDRPFGSRKGEAITAKGLDLIKRRLTTG